MILRTCNLTKQYDGIVALDNVTVEFQPGSITALVGPNGAGKSTLFNTIFGLVAADSGDVTLGNGGEIRLTGLAPHIIARKGVGMLFQDVRVFHKLTALENVAVAIPNQLGEHPIKSMLSQKMARARERQALDIAKRNLEFVGLTPNANVPADQLSYGQQKLVALARLLAAGARVLLLDEPTSGVDSGRVNQLLDRVQFLAEDERLTVIMIEHNRDIVAAISNRVYYLESGRIVAYGSPDDVLQARGRSGQASHTGL